MVSHGPSSKDLGSRRVPTLKTGPAGEKKKRLPVAWVPRHHPVEAATGRGGTIRGRLGVRGRGLTARVPTSSSHARHRSPCATAERVVGVKDDTRPIARRVGGRSAFLGR